MRWSRTSTTCESSTRTVLQDRKSTRLNSSHGYISYAVFCLKKKTVWIEHRRHLVKDEALPPHLHDSRDGDPLLLTDGALVWLPKAELSDVDRCSRLVYSSTV